MVVEKEHPALLVLQTLEPGQHQFVDAARREDRALDHGGGFLEKAAPQFESGQDAGRLARSDAAQGQHPVGRKVEQRAQPAVGEIQQLSGQVQGAAFPVAAAQQDGEQFAVAQAPRSAGEHLFARPLIRAEFLDRHNGLKDKAKNRIKRKYSCGPYEKIRFLMLCHPSSVFIDSMMALARRMRVRTVFSSMPSSSAISLYCRPSTRRIRAMVRYSSGRPPM